MNCPIDGNKLMMSERHGVEIDYCPVCRGVWLDRGELDKIIEKNSDSQSSQSHQPDESRHHSRDDRADSYKKKKKESFLGELFDF